LPGTEAITVSLVQTRHRFTRIDRRDRVVEAGRMPHFSMSRSIVESPRGLSRFLWQETARMGLSPLRRAGSVQLTSLLQDPDYQGENP
jgi:hypothetical protein